jgi:hypothetical protein
MRNVILMEIQIVGIRNEHWGAGENWGYTSFCQEDRGCIEKI